MISSSLDGKTVKRVSIYDIPDLDDHYKWTQSIDEIIPNYDIVFSNDDFTHSLYQKIEKDVISVELKSREILSGTNIRKMILNEENWQDLVPDGERNILLKINAKNRLECL